MNEPLRVAKHTHEVFPFLTHDQPLESPVLPLQGVYTFGLFPGLVDREHEAAVLQLLVDLDRCGGKKDHHRAFNVILLRLHAAGLRVLAG